MPADSMSMIVMLVVMVAVFYFFLIRPENKKKKAMNEMRSSLKVGDNITTIGGVVGDIVFVKDENIVIETGADKVRIEFKAAAKAKEAAMAARNEAKKKKKG